MPAMEAMSEMIASVLVLAAGRLAVGGRRLAVRGRGLAVGGRGLAVRRRRRGRRRAVSGRRRRGGRHRRARLVGKVRIGHGRCSPRCCGCGGRRASGAGGVARAIRGIRCLRCTHYRGGCTLHSLCAAGRRQTWISVTGRVESAPNARSDGAVPRHDELRAERGDHRAVVGAERQRRNAQRDARGIRPLLRPPRAAARWRRRRRRAAAAARRGRRRRRRAFVTSTSTTASRKLAATSASGTGSPAASRCSTQRATAVFSPEKREVVAVRRQVLRQA